MRPAQCTAWGPTKQQWHKRAVPQVPAVRGQARRRRSLKLLCKCRPNGVILVIFTGPMRMFIVCWLKWCEIWPVWAHFSPGNLERVAAIVERPNGAASSDHRSRSTSHWTKRNVSTVQTSHHEHHVGCNDTRSIDVHETHLLVCKLGPEIGQWWRYERHKRRLHCGRACGWFTAVDGRCRPLIFLFSPPPSSRSGRAVAFSWR